MARTARRCQSPGRGGRSVQVPLHLLELFLADLSAHIPFLEDLKRSFLSMSTPTAAAAEVPSQVHSPDSQSCQNDEPESRPYPPEREAIASMHPTPSKHLP